MIYRDHDVICRAHEIISRGHTIICRAHGIICQGHRIVCRAHEIISCFYKIVFPDQKNNFLNIPPYFAICEHFTKNEPELFVIVLCIF